MMKKYEWYDRVVEGMQLCGLAPRSVQSYVREIRKLCEHPVEEYFEIPWVNMVATCKKERGG